jgi:hypothetical protein
MAHPYAVTKLNEKKMVGTPVYHTKSTLGPQFYGLSVINK